MFVEVVLFVVAVLVVFLRILLKKDSEPLHGVYSQPGLWFLAKKWLMVVVLTVLRRRSRLATLKEAAKSPYKSGDPGFGVKSRTQAELLERPQQLTDDENAIDCMYFNGLDSSGSYVIFRIARRHRRMAEISLSVNIPGVGSFQSPIHPDTSVYNVDCSDSFSAAGIKFECLEPMKRWKITYNGLMRKGLSNLYTTEPFETVHAQITLIWCAFTDPVDLRTDTHPALVAASVASERWSPDYFKRLSLKAKDVEVHYEQWGELWGSCQLDSLPELNLRLRGYRHHFNGSRDWNDFDRANVCLAYIEDGSVIQVSCVSQPGLVSLFHCGYYITPSAETVPITWTDLNVALFDNNLDSPDERKFSFKAGGRLYHVKLALKTSLQYFMHEDWRSVVQEKVSSYEVNGVKGYGVCQYLKRHSGSCPLTRVESLPLLCEPTCIESGDNEALALTFSRPGCSSSKLVGGKGCQLALLTQLNSQEFSVPKGFCLTVRAFEIHLKSNPNIQLAIDHLNNISCTNPDGLQSACSVVVERFKTSQLSTVVNNSLVAHLVRVFGDNYSNKSLAVRSSATGEDGLELSGAGQMITILGAKGLQQITDAICNCWASAFAFAAVSYRRQYGQSIKLSAGVVIQEMAPAAAAGVLFTRHPVTGNPGVMVLNANYGLGESVVSGQCEPDEILVSRSWDDKLTILNKTLGHKKLQIRLKAGGGTEEVVDAGNVQNKYCLEDDVSLKLASIGVELEKRFGNSRDIEFAVDTENRIYLLQARPITAVDRESDDYLLHEFDTALCTDTERLTTANIQEVMPRAGTPLTLSTTMRCGDEVIQLTLIYDQAKFVHKSLTYSLNQVLFNVMPFIWTCNPYTLTGNKCVTELSVLGEVQDDLTMQFVQHYNGYPSLWKILRWELQVMNKLRTTISDLPMWTERIKRLEIVDHSNNSTDGLYISITRLIHVYREVNKHHIDTSMASAVWSNILMTIITKNQRVWNTDHISDVALLLSDCKDVLSAGVPTAIDHLVLTLRENESDATAFAELPVEEAVKWLQSSASGSAGTEFAEFLAVHGHRCVSEFELRETSWAAEPGKIVKVLQTMLKSPKSHNSRNRSSSVENIKTQLSPIVRSILRWVLPRVRRAVGYRELSKSQGVKVNDILKCAYRELATAMLNEGRLPDTDLIYFFTHREIGQLLKTRSGRMIARAQRRRQLYPKQIAARFPRILFKHPRLECIVAPSGDRNDIKDSSLKLTGLPVSQGEIRGKARVVTSLEHASQIQAGDILIAPYTDIGWSPYFPLISGLATEIGGIISHGAVIAREYGLPCVVSIPRATELFKSGDVVLLNGTAGTLEKLD